MKRVSLAISLILFGTMAASAADLAAHYTKAPVMAPSYNWTGFYVGGNVGGQWGSSNSNTSTVFDPFGYFADTSVTAVNAVGAQHINSSSVTGGLTAGYNWQVNNAVFGFQGDINYFGFKGSATGSAVYPCCAPVGFTVNSSVSADWLATIRGRIGVLATPNWLIYATGGAAIADVKGDFTFTDGFMTESGAIRDTRVGWTAGVGGEYAVGNGWSLKAEYLYVDLGRASMRSTNLGGVFGPFPASVFTHSADLKSNIVRVGVNYNFGGPAVARY
ncbi:porin family protein [Bradyrhizobium manausense]|uniref:outer membrane protein n=1 Tax=Bradyrhizobium TaxID=374 RepID=UPI001BA5414C|nr:MULTISPECIES: outer membrane beta-barrel protein [Bradyrhizobium]MBR0828706.1 porin family protein [Bradyrhizobium manausense]UVO32589.1 outer membrane beta-barrel protein [Bradyrhizobium arachidis]